jgi:hypothetical protein
LCCVAQHIDWHLEVGFAVVFVERAADVREIIQPPPDWVELCPLFDEFESAAQAGRQLSTTGLSTATKRALGLGIGIGVGGLLILAAVLFVWTRWKRHQQPGAANAPTTEMTRGAVPNQLHTAGSGPLELHPPEDDEQPSQGLLYSPVNKQPAVPAAVQQQADL